jgi:hypothetical protein
MELRNDLIEELRDRARRGDRPCALAELIGRRLDKEGASYRLQAIAYFQEAFGLTLTEAMHIGAAPVFEQTGRSADDIDAELMEMLNEHRPIWESRTVLDDSH